MITTLRIRSAPGARRRPRHFEALHREFPTVRLAEDEPDRLPSARVSCSRWRTDPLDLWAFDRGLDALGEAGPFAIELLDARSGAVEIAIEVLTRAQRWIRRRNPASSSPEFDRVLAALRSLHDLSRPLRRADYDYALDAWQWLLRLEPAASRAVQVAVLFHHVARRTSAADLLPATVPAGAAFEADRARRAAEVALDALDRSGFPPEELFRVAELVSSRERPGADPERSLVDDADALSFFSQKSSGYLAYFGAEATRRKVRYMLARLSENRRWHLGRIRLEPEVAAMARAEQARERRRPGRSGRRDLLRFPARA